MKRYVVLFAIFALPWYLNVLLWLYIANTTGGWTWGVEILMWVFALISTWAVADRVQEEELAAHLDD